MEDIVPSILQLAGSSTRYILHKICGSKKSFDDFSASEDNRKKKGNAEAVSQGCLNYLVGIIVCGLIIFLVVWFVKGST